MRKARFLTLNFCYILICKHWYFDKNDVTLINLNKTYLF